MAMSSVPPASIAPPESVAVGAHVVAVLLSLNPALSMTSLIGLMGVQLCLVLNLLAFTPFHSAETAK
jgi:hypothetical protein